MTEKRTAYPKNMAILMVEDEIKIASFVKKGLEMEHYDVDLAHDGHDGLAKAERNDYELIILDLMLPGIDGLEICKTLRRKNIKTPIIMLTARDTFEDMAAGLNAGADDYLIKPFSFGELTARIKALLRRNKSAVAASDGVPEKEGVEKDPDSHVGKKSLPAAEDKDGEQVAEEKMSKLSEFNKRILDNAPISIITIDKEGFITSANRYFENFSKSGDYRNHNIFSNEFFIRENLLDDYKRLLTDGTEVARESCYQKNSKGEDKYLKIIAVPLRDKEGNIEGALSMAMDNTETVLSKNKLEELNKSLEAKVRQRTVKLDEANKELSKVLRLKATFMADVSHEMRTSLAIIQGNLELIARGFVAEADSEETYGQVFNEIDRMSAMLTDLAMLADSESSVQKMNFEKIDLNRLIASVTKSLKVVADKRNIRIEHKNSMDGIAGIEIIGDGNKLEKLLMNLVRNAIRYNKENGRISIWVEEAGDGVILKVEDTGIGIPDDHLPHIFERFYRVDKARSRNDGGSGLGLAICKWVVEAHGGRIEVSSKIGQGSLFTVRLPRDRR